MYLNATLAIVFFLVYLDIPSYLFVLNSSILPKYLYFASGAIIAPLLLLKIRKFLQYLVSPFSLWVFAEIIIHSYDLLDGSEAVRLVINERNQYLILSLLIGFTTSIAHTKTFEGIFPFLATIIPTLVIIDFISPGVFYPIGTEGSVLGRAAAMYINANRAGIAILFTCLLAIPVMRLHYRMPLLMLAGAGSIVTFSRSTIILWILFWFFLLITRKLPKYSFVLPLLIIGILPLLLTGFKSYLQGRQDLDQGISNMLERLDFFQTRSIDDDSAQVRKGVLESGWKIFLENPVFGTGTGITEFRSNFWPHDVNTHNQIVMAAAEHGILGIALFVWLLVILWRGSYFQDVRFQFAAAGGTFFMAFFDNHMLSELTLLVTFALISGRRQY